MRLPEHAHCKFCRDPIQFGDDYCSEDCRLLHTEKEKKENRRTNIFFILALATIVGLTIFIQIMS